MAMAKGMFCEAGPLLVMRLWLQALGSLLILGAKLPLCQHVLSQFQIPARGSFRSLKQLFRAIIFRTDILEADVEPTRLEKGNDPIPKLLLQHVRIV